MSSNMTDVVMQESREALQELLAVLKNECFHFSKLSNATRVIIFKLGESWPQSDKTRIRLYNGNERMGLLICTEGEFCVEVDCVRSPFSGLGDTSIIVGRRTLEVSYVHIERTRDGAEEHDDTVAKVMLTGQDADWIAQELSRIHLAATLML